MAKSKSVSNICSSFDLDCRRPSRRRCAGTPRGRLGASAAASAGNPARDARLPK
jgi:hypothetical protein